MASKKESRKENQQPESMLRATIRELEANPGAPSRLAKHPYFNAREKKRWAFIKNYTGLVEGSVIQDIDNFYEDLRVVKRHGFYENAPWKDRITAYTEMVTIAKRYSGNPILKKGLCQAENTLLGIQKE